MDFDLESYLENQLDVSIFLIIVVQFWFFDFCRKQKNLKLSKWRSKMVIKSKKSGKIISKNACYI